MSIHKSRFLQEEHGWMEWEVAMSWWVDELERQLESTRRESQDRAAEATGARAAELLWWNRRLLPSEDSTQ